MSELDMKGNILENKYTQDILVGKEHRGKERLCNLIKTNLLSSYKIMGV